MRLRNLQGIIFTVFLLFSSVHLSGQELWTLEKCIEHATKENLNVKQSRLQKYLARRNFSISKSKFFPIVNASVNTGYNWGRNFDSNTFLFTNDRTSSSGVTISSSIDIFNGFSKLNTLRKSKESYDLSGYAYKKAINDISLQIASAYIKILFDMEQLENAQKQIKVTILQYERIEKLVKAGNLPKGDLYNLEAQKASEELAIINAQNTLDNDYLSLIQLLDISSDQDFKIAKPIIESVSSEKYPFNVDMIFNEAKDSLPEIRIAESNLQIARLNSKIAVGNYFPSLSGSGAIRSSSSSEFSESINQQIDDNRRDYLGLTLSIPIFNNLQTSEVAAAAQFDVKSKEIDLEMAYNGLYKTIQKAYQEMLSAQKKYEATKNQKKALDEAFKYSQQKYDVGMVNSYDFADSKNKLRKAESDLLSAKYDFIFKTKVLDFYRGKPLTL
ncbi:TolC family protein [Cytophagaceae bacterium AH-315-L13]|nr:TolC family protein [Cytophagaceae bacterium AH-315-L13]